MYFPSGDHECRNPRASRCTGAPSAGGIAARDEVAAVHIEVRDRQCVAVGRPDRAALLRVGRCDLLGVAVAQPLNEDVTLTSAKAVVCELEPI